MYAKLLLPTRARAMRLNQMNTLAMIYYGLPPVAAFAAFVFMVRQECNRVEPKTFTQSISEFIMFYRMLNQTHAYMLKRKIHIKIMHDITSEKCLIFMQDINFSITWIPGRYIRLLSDNGNLSLVKSSLLLYVSTETYNQTQPIKQANLFVYLLRVIRKMDCNDSVINISKFQNN